jgi:hypothetical protein
VTPGNYSGLNYFCEMFSARLTAGLAGALLLLPACSGGGAIEDASSAAGAAAAVAPAIATDAPDYLARIDSASRYVRSLCSIDIESAFTAEDPLAVIVELLGSVTVEDDIQTTERDQMVAAFAGATNPSDPDALQAVLKAGDILRARCR